MKRILLMATGGTIASAYTTEGLAPQIPVSDLLLYVDQYKDFCDVDTYPLFNLDSTNIKSEHWILIKNVIEAKYDDYDGFVICHGTDTMAYTAAALSYLIQNSRKPIVLTGAQKPIDLPVTDARTNLIDSLRFATDDRAYGTCIVFDGKVIAGTRAKKERSKSYNAFSSINYPAIAMIQDERITFYIDDKDKLLYPLFFYHRMCEDVLVLKLIPGMDALVLNRLFPYYRGVIIESYGVGGLPDYGEHTFFQEIERWTKAGKVVMMSTQVTHEGSDMGIYRVGRMMKNSFDLMEAYDMTLEATVTKMMWALAVSKDISHFRELFYNTINHDILLV